MAVLDFPSFCCPMLDQFQEVHSHLGAMTIGTQVGLAMLGDSCIITKTPVLHKSLLSFIFQGNTIRDLGRTSNELVTDLETKEAPYFSCSKR